MAGADKIDIDDLRKILDRKNEKILELSRINAENQKSMQEQSEIQKILLEDDKDQLLLKKIEELQKKVQENNTKNAIKDESKPADKKQLELMKGAIKKIKNLQASLEEKNKTIKELKEQATDITEFTQLKSDLMEKTNQLAKKEKEIASLEAEFVNFKDEFIKELKTIEKGEISDSNQAFKTKELLDKIKELESKTNKAIEEKSTIQMKLKENKKQIKDLKFMLKMKEDQVEQMSDKIDNLLLEKKNGVDIDEEINLKIQIRVNELELTREQIIRSAALLGRELPEISKTGKIFDLIDDLLLISEDTHLAKVNEWKKSLQKSDSMTVEKIDAIEKIMDEEPKISEENKKSSKKSGDITKRLKDHEKEEEIKEMIQEEDELRKLIRREIPNITEIEAAILQDQLQGLDVEERNTRIEMYRLTKELEE